MAEKKQNKTILVAVGVKDQTKVLCATTKKGIALLVKCNVVYLRAQKLPATIKGFYIQEVLLRKVNRKGVTKEQNPVKVITYKQVSQLNDDLL